MIFLVYLAFFFLTTSTLGLSLLQSGQNTLLPIQTGTNPFIIPLEQKTISNQKHKIFKDRLQQSHSTIKSSSFLQRETKPFNLDEYSGRAIVPLENHQNTQVDYLS